MSGECGSQEGDERKESGDTHAGQSKGASAVEQNRRTQKERRGCARRTARVDLPTEAERSR